MTPWTIHQGDALQVLRGLPAGSAHACITSPPYWGLRAYMPEGAAGAELELGLEQHPSTYLERLWAIFGEVARVLRPDGTAWVNLGDTYAGSWGSRGRSGKGTNWEKWGRSPGLAPQRVASCGVSNKSLVGIPWRFALGMMERGWVLRQEIVWHKPNAKPESAQDRPTTDHEKIFLFARWRNYYFDGQAVREPGSRVGWEDRNIRSTWSVATRPGAPGGHFAQYPPELVVPCVRAGTSERGCCPACGAPWRRIVDRTRLLDGRHPDQPMPAARNTCKVAPSGATGIGHNRIQTLREDRGWVPGCSCDAGAPVPCTVLDPFAGAGTTGLVTLREGRRFVGVELNPVYAVEAERRIRDDAPLLWDLTP